VRCTLVALELAQQAAAVGVKHLRAGRQAGKQGWYESGSSRQVAVVITQVSAGAPAPAPAPAPTGPSGTPSDSLLPPLPLLPLLLLLPLLPLLTCTMPSWPPATMSLPSLRRLPQ
jgi:hypothetical protein